MTKQKMLPVLKEMRGIQWQLWEDYRIECREKPESWRREMRDLYEMKVRVLDQIITEMEEA